MRAYARVCLARLRRESLSLETAVAPHRVVGGHRARLPVAAQRRRHGREERVSAGAAPRPYDPVPTSCCDAERECA